MNRKELIALLQEGEHSVNELALRFGIKPKDIVEDIGHIQKTIRREGFSLEIIPAQCRKCGFKFKKDKIDKPGKCPRCKSTWIAEPRFRLTAS